ncbi:MAG: hypothetical protein CUN55_12455, partial [Phototrophicales bacterium]
FEVEDRGDYWAIKSFTNRKFLMHRETFFREMLPLRPEWLSWKRHLLSQFTQQSALINWEVMMTRQLARKGFLRGDIKTDQCWMLHTPDHGAQFMQNLDRLIERVEAGDYPLEQAGDYDLQLQAWIK